MKAWSDGLVSVITPAFNCERFIGDAIESVLAQTHTDWEMIIVDDCSTDRTMAVVKRFEDPRVRYYRMEKNVGAAEARNYALGQAKGRYVAFLDADDLWKPTKLRVQLDFMKKSNIGFCFTAYEMARGGKSKVIEVPRTLTYAQFMKNTIIGTSTVVIDRHFTGDVRLVNVRKDHDSMTWAKMLREGITAYGLNENLATYRKVRGSISNDKLSAAKTHWRNCREVEGLSFWRCLYYFTFYAANALKKHYL